jgi:plasmid rolling circle replication initiator protein Rep
MTQVIATVTGFEREKERERDVGKRVGRNGNILNVSQDSVNVKSKYYTTQKCHAPLCQFIPFNCFISSI